MESYLEQGMATLLDYMLEASLVERLATLKDDVWVFLMVIPKVIMLDFLLVT